MILHDIIYEWDGKTHTGKKPITWWPGAYRVRIVRLGTDTGNVSFLTPFAVICKGIPKKEVLNTSLRNCIENFAKAISEAYKLDIAKALWVELGDPVKVALFKKEGNLTDETFYTVTWRPARPPELAMIEPYISDMNQAGTH